MNTYKLSKDETHQLLLKSNLGLSPYSAFNRFIIDFEINEALKLNHPEDLEQNPSPKGLMNSAHIIMQPERSCELLMNADRNYFMSEFLIKDNKAVEYACDEKGTNYIHDIVDKELFLINIVESFANKFKPKEKINPSNLRFEFSIEEYMVMVSILYLEKDKEVLQQLDENEFPVITKSKIVEFIKNESQFNGIWLTALFDLIEIEKFVSNLDEEVDKMIDSLMTKRYIKKNQSTQIISITDVIHPLLDYIKSFIQSTITINVEIFPTDSKPDGFKSVIAILYSELACFKILFRNKKLQFIPLYSKEDIKDVFEEIIFKDTYIPSDLLRPNIEKKEKEQESIFCSDCGTKMMITDNFCRSCGSKI